MRIILMNTRVFKRDLNNRTKYYISLYLSFLVFLPFPPPALLLSFYISPSFPRLVKKCLLFLHFPPPLLFSPSFPILVQYVEDGGEKLQKKIKPVSGRTKGLHHIYIFLHNLAIIFV